MLQEQHATSSGLVLVSLRQLTRLAEELDLLINGRRAGICWQKEGIPIDSQQSFVQQQLL